MIRPGEAYGKTHRRPTGGSPRPPEEGCSALELRILAPPRPGRRDLRVWGLGILAVFLLTAAAAPFLHEQPASAALPAGLPAGEAYPILVRPTFERALRGDAGAMRMMGALYQRGEYLPRDEREAARWYRLAMAAGEPEAVKDLERVEATACR